MTVLFIFTNNIYSFTLFILAASKLDINKKFISLASPFFWQVSSCNPISKQGGGR